MSRVRALSVVAFFTASGCAIGPRYERPSLAMPDGYSQRSPTAAASSSHNPRSSVQPWWALFNDPQLDRLLTQALKNSPTLTVAQARAMTRHAAADLFPQLNASAAVTRSRISPNAVYFPDPIRSAIDPLSTDERVSADFGWTVDLWGQKRQARAAARALWTSAERERDATELILTTDVAVQYFERLSLGEQAAAYGRLSERLEEQAGFLAERAAAGLNRDDEVRQVRIAQAMAHAQKESLESQAQIAEHSLAVLCGAVPESLNLRWATSALPTPPLIPTGLPSDLLNQRPDLASLEARLRAATAKVGVAQTNFLPSFELFGTGGFESLDAGTFLDWESRLWSIGPHVNLPLFTGGRNRATLALAKAELDEATARYRQGVLDSLKDVEDSLVRLKHLSVQDKDYATALDSASSDSSAAQVRRQAGLASEIDVITIEQQAWQSQAAWALVRGQYLTETVRLIKALGGSLST